MLRVFRKIRHNLLAQGKTVRYLKYALGEVLLLTIGILLALQVNNWNQNRINHHKEKLLLEGLKSDLEGNLEQYDFFQDINDVKITVLRDLVEKKLDTMEKSLEGNTYDIFLTRLRGAPSVRENAYIEMVNSGKISLLSSPVLKEEIFNYYSYLEDRKVTLNSTFGDWSTILSSLLPAESVITDPADESFRSLKASAIAPFLQTLKNELEILRPHINTEMQYAIKYKQNVMGLQRECAQVLESITQELDEW